MRQVSSLFQPNCAFCEESTTFDTCVDYHITNIFEYWEISNSASGGCGSHFSKWPTADTVMMHICFTGEECRLTVKDDLLVKVQQWSKKVTIFQKCLLRGQYLAIKVT